jgi:cell wall-associated NlpC family hydrolase
MHSAPVYRDQTSAIDAELPRVNRDDLLSEISSYHGAPYLEGGTTTTGIDCSGLVSSVFGSLGVGLPRTALEQYGRGEPVGRKNARTGDLVFFTKGSRPSHVGIAISNREMVHSSKSRGVVLESIDEFSRSMKLVGIRRVVSLN